MLHVDYCLLIALTHALPHLCSQHRSQWNHSSVPGPLYPPPYACAISSMVFFLLQLRWPFTSSNKPGTFFSKVFTLHNLSAWNSWLSHYLLLSDVFLQSNYHYLMIKSYLMVTQAGWISLCTRTQASWRRGLMSGLLIADLLVPGTVHSTEQAWNT